MEEATTKELKLLEIIESIDISQKDCSFRLS